MPAAAKKKQPAPEFVPDSVFRRLREQPFQTEKGRLVRLGPTILGSAWEISVTLNDGDVAEDKMNVVQVEISPRLDDVQFDVDSEIADGVTFMCNGLHLADLGHLLVETERTLRHLGMREPVQAEG